MRTILEKQKRAVEKVTGRYWNTWSEKALEAYFTFTDTGKTISVPSEVKDEFEELVMLHRFHPYTIESWKTDFRKGLLFLEVFIQEDTPEAYLIHVFEIFRGVFGLIPSRYTGVCEKLGIERVGDVKESHRRLGEGHTFSLPNYTLKKYLD